MRGVVDDLQQQVDQLEGIVANELSCIVGMRY